MLGANAATSARGFHLAISGRKTTINPAFQSLNRIAVQQQQQQQQQQNVRSYSRNTNVLRSFQCRASSQKETYQKFRPPSTVQTGPGTAENLQIDEQLNILRNRIGLWHEYADLIPVVSRSGFTPAALEEATGISGVEQNQITVASRVRSSLVSSGFDENFLAYFDVGGAEILYEFRMLSAEQRKSAAKYAIENSIDAKQARDLAKAMKDFERRRMEGRDSFSSNPGDCLAFSFYRQSKECKTDSERESALQKALSFAVTEKARNKLLEALGGCQDKEEEQSAEIFQRLVVVRLNPGEVAEAKLPLVLPVIDANVEDFRQAPSRRALGEGPFAIYRSETAWKSWVVLPGWEPLIDAEAPVVLSFADAKILPWRVRSGDREESILLVVDKAKTAIEAQGFYLVASDGGSLLIQRGSAISASAGSVLGMAVLVVRPPRPESEEAEMIDWD